MGVSTPSSFLAASGWWGEVGLRVRWRAFLSILSQLPLVLAYRGAVPLRAVLSILSQLPPRAAPLQRLSIPQLSFNSFPAASVTAEVDGKRKKVSFNSFLAASRARFRGM